MKHLFLYEFWKHQNKENKSIFATENKDPVIREDTIILDFVDLEETIRKKCENFSWDDKPIFRSVPLPINCYIIDPKKYKRKSKGLINNYYTLIIDNSKKWKGYPKRSKSLICSLGKYWSHELYRVIPFDNSNWGVCDTDDIWFSFKYLRDKIDVTVLTSLNRMINSLNSMFFDTIIPDNSYSAFKNRMMEIEKKINSLSYSGDITLETKISYSNLKFSDLKNKSILNFLDDLLEPTKNGFKINSYKELILKEKSIVSNEIWSDSKCILVSIRFLDINYKP